MSLHFTLGVYTKKSMFIGVYVEKCKVYSLQLIKNKKNENKKKYFFSGVYTLHFTLSL
jgi:hypothetical protein